MDAEIPTGEVVVVIDVIRAFTTAAVAFERGVTEIACAPSVEVGRDLRRLHPGCPEPAALLAVSALNVGATARWIASNYAETPCTLICTGRTAEDWACAKHLSGLLNGSAPRRAELVAGIVDGAAEHARAYAQLPASERADLSDDLRFCCDVDRAEFAMVGDVREDHVVLAKMPC